MRRTLLTHMLLGASVFSVIAALGPGCGTDPGPESTFDAGAPDGTVADTGADSPFELPETSTGDTGPGRRETGPRDGSAVEDIVITPAIGEITVTIEDGVIKPSPTVQFTAKRAGADVPVTWFLDRGELGQILANGTFSANGAEIGETKVTATYADSIGFAKARVKVLRTQNGRPASEATQTGQGGYAGVGGEPLGGAVDATRTTKIKTAVPTAAPTLSWLYPYAETVFPRGILAPMLQWKFDKAADAVYIKLAYASGGSFEGVYELDNTTNVSAQRAKIEQEVWRQFTNGNNGDPTDPIKIDVRILGVDGNVYALPQRNLRVAPGQLKGTVYYSSYNSKFTGGAPGAPKELGGVLAIQPKSANPVLAIPAESGKCFGCHSLSADGSTMFAQFGGTSMASPIPGDQDPVFNYEKAPLDHTVYPWSVSYDLRNNGTKTDYPTKVYANTPNDPNATDDNAHKFAWSGVYPDGSFAITSNGYTREARTKDRTRAFARGTGAEVPVDGLANVIKDAVTPAFSANGKKLAFNFWSGNGAGNVTAGAGHSLALLDFNCGQAPGSPACAGGAKTFSGLRELYRGDANTFVSWPSFVPDASAIVFQRANPTSRSPFFCPSPAIAPGGAPYTGSMTDNDNFQTSTWYFSAREIWLAKDTQGSAAAVMNALNGYDDAGARTLPASAAPNLPTGNAQADAMRQLPTQCQLNFMPTVNPIASGGYYWVVFTSRRRYGNVLDTHPFDGLDPRGARTFGYGSTQKKLWVSAISLNGDGSVKSASPAFYMPGQELGSGNARGFWVVDPCKNDGSTCESGDECCGGGCRANGAGGALTCQPIPAGSCSGEFERCVTDADCCNPEDRCLGNSCSYDGQGR